MKLVLTFFSSIVTRKGIRATVGLAFLLIHTTWLQSVSAQNTLECLDSVDPSIDYFPNKVVPTASEYWDIEYFNTYKVVTNKYNNATYLLYQCGTNVIDLLTGDVEYNATIEVPISKVSVTSVNTISFLEQLNKVDSVVAYTEDVSYIGSPCLKESIADGNVFVVRNRTVLDEYISTDLVASTVLQLDDVVSFNGPWDTNFPFESNVITSTENELTNAAVFEWVKFFSAFFNLEDIGNKAFEAAEDRSSCIKKSSSAVTADGSNPVVLWGYYSDYCGGWDLATCPNYYCEFANTCSATLIEVEDGVGSVNATELCGTMYLNMTEVINAGGADADYWIFAADNWDATYELFATELDTFKSVQNKQVYDIQGSGINAWFERRLAEYYNVEQDFCSVVGTTSGLNVRGWFRNALQNETVGGINETCADINKTAILPYDFTCDIMITTDEGSNQTGSKNTTTDTTDEGNNQTGSKNTTTDTTDEGNNQTGGKNTTTDTTDEGNSQTGGKNTTTDTTDEGMNDSGTNGNTTESSSACSISLMSSIFWLVVLCVGMLTLPGIELTSTCN